MTSCYKSRRIMIKTVFLATTILVVGKVSMKEISGNGLRKSFSEKLGLGEQKLPTTEQKLQVKPKFGEDPTNRVLPVDDLSEEDYDEVVAQEDAEQDELFAGHAEEKNYCSRLLRADLMRILKRMSQRAGRQSEDEGENQDSTTRQTLLQEYLAFDPSEIVSPLLNIVGSVMSRNVSGIDMHYKRLPPYIKTEVTDFLSIFTELLRVPIIST